jgi:hypothetical protein
MITISFDSCSLPMKVFAENSPTLIANGITDTIIDRIDPDVNTVDISKSCSFELTAKYNCCDSTKIVHTIYPAYNFTVTYRTDSSIEWIDLTGIHPEVIDLFEIRHFEYGEVLADHELLSNSYASYDALTGIISTQDWVFQGQPNQTYIYIKNKCGFEYFIFLDGQLNDGDSALGFYNANRFIQDPIGYPEAISGISWDEAADWVLLDAEVFNLPTFTDGVYMVTITEKAYVEDVNAVIVIFTETHMFFRDCETKCDVQLLAMKCEDPMHLYRWHALTANNSCRVLEYDDACKMYQMLYDAIKYSCVIPKDCNCR